jgi:hypothetical protein
MTEQQLKSVQSPFRTIFHLMTLILFKKNKSNYSANLDIRFVKKS